MSATSWDGWVLYTSEEGCKYYWNHQTHESRWAAEEPPAQDCDAEESLRDDTRQRLSFIHSRDERRNRPSRVDLGEDVEQGHDDDDDDDDNTIVSTAFEREHTSDALVTPYAGIGPMVERIAEHDRHKEISDGRNDTGVDGFATRLTCVLRQAMSRTMKRRNYPHRDKLSYGSASEWDPELGQVQYTYHKPSYHRSPQRETSSGSCNGSSASSDGSSDGSDDSSSSDSTNSSFENEDEYMSRADSSEQGQFRNCGNSTKWLLHTSSQRTCSSMKRKGSSRRSSIQERQLRRRDRARRSHARDEPLQNAPGRRERVDRSGTGEKRLSERTRLGENNSKAAAASTMLSARFKSVGRQTVAKVLQMCSRAVVGGWTGMAAAAVKIAKTWQAHRALDKTGLPTTTSTNNNQKPAEKLEQWSAGNGHNFQEHNKGGRQRTPFTKIEHGFRHLLAPSWTGASFDGRSVTGRGGVHGRNVLVEGLQEDEGEREGEVETGSWVGGEDSDRSSRKAGGDFVPICDRLLEGLAEPTK